MKNKKFGFTLAEVLITLAIIGVVAALTLPTLLTNYEKKEWTTRLIKTQAELTQGFKMMMAKEGVSQLSQTEAWTNIPKDVNIRYCHGNSSNPICVDFYKKLLNTFNGEIITLPDNVQDITLLDSKPFSNPEKNFVMKLHSGTIFRHVELDTTPITSEYDVEALGGNMKNRVMHANFDINGEKGPNQFGRDVFAMSVTDEGEVIPQGSINSAIYRYGDITKDWHSEEPYYSCNKGSRGPACAARVLEEGAMNY